MAATEDYHMATCNSMQVFSVFESTAGERGCGTGALRRRARRISRACAKQVFVQIEGD